jgi:hypothetical protein
MYAHVCVCAQDLTMWLLAAGQGHVFDLIFVERTSQRRSCAAFYVCQCIEQNEIKYVGDPCFRENMFVALENYRRDRHKCD